MYPETEPSYAARLRALRYILGKDNKPLSGEEFAPMAGMKSGTLRAIEAGLRKLNVQDEERIAERLGAMWDEQKNGWYCVIAPHTPYTADLQRLYQNARVSGMSFDFSRGTAAYAQSLQVMWDYFPKPEFFSTVLAIHRLILSAAKRNGVPPEAMEALKLQSPLDLSALKAYNLQFSKKISRPQPARKKGTTLSAEGGKSPQN
jgi:hypothetical protein